MATSFSSFDPGKAEGFVEGNAAQYTWMIPYDLKGIIDAVGRPQAAEARLDDYFSQSGSTAACCSNCGKENAQHGGCLKPRAVG